MRKGSIDEYATHHPNKECLNAFIESKEMFSITNNCGYNKPAFSMYNKFLRDAGLISSKSIEPLANILFEKGFDDEAVWGLIFANLAYAPQIGWLEPVHIKIASKIIAKVRFPKYRTSSLS